MSVLRSRPLPATRARGKLVVCASVVGETELALRSFRGADGQPHEGMVFWLGRRAGADAYILSIVIPECQHGPQRVIAAEKGVGDAARVARSMRLGVIAQVHSHPGLDTRHSDGDDELILMPFEGMYSLVVPSYGAGGLGLEGGLGVHQYQDGRWAKVDPPISDAVVVVPSRAGP